MALIQTLAPGLLLSMPQLADPNFTRAVVLMLEHSDTGSFGLIVNQESDLSIREVVANIDAEWNGPMDAHVWRGGPVMPGSAWVLHSPSSHLGRASLELDEALEDTGLMRVSNELFLSTSEENIRILSEYPPKDMRFILGYAGWGPNQLATEMAQGAWPHADVDTDVLFHTDGLDIWDTLLDKMGIDPENIVHAHGVH